MKMTGELSKKACCGMKRSRRLRKDRLRESVQTIINFYVHRPCYVRGDADIQVFYRLRTGHRNIVKTVQWEGKVLGSLPLLHRLPPSARDCEVVKGFQHAVTKAIPSQRLT